VPPPAKAGSATPAGSRQMSGQLNVDDILALEGAAVRRSG
jgi:hypothetical protein